MSKDNFEDKYNDYDESAVSGDYDSYDMEETVRMSRKARREAREKRKVKRANVNKEVPSQTAQDSENETKKIDTKSAPKSDFETSKQEEQVSPSRTAKKNKKKKKSLKAKFLTIVFAIVGIYAVIIVGCLGYTYLNLDPESTETIPTPGDIIGNVTKEITDIATGNIPERTTFLLLVTDEDKTRTDTIVLGNYDNVNGRLSMVSIPRDTIVSVSAATYEVMRSEYPEPGSKVMKINAIHHYGGENHGIELLLNELDRLYDFQPDYYIRLDFDAFDYMVDSIGGIEFNVPIDMKYDDPTQDLHIDLSAGLQTLNGEQAQHLVRYRKDNYGGGYPGGDLQRIQVQQEFMKTFITKAVSADSIMKNPTAYITAFFKYVKTDITVVDAVKYIKAAKSFDTSQIYTYTMPGDVAYIDGISGYDVYEDEAEELLYDIFKKPLNEVKAEIEQEQAVADSIKSTDKSIMVLNGGYKNGRASEIKDVLENSGLTVSEIGSYDGAKEEYTRIYVAEEGVGEDIKLLIDNSEIVVDSTVTAEYGYDIVVVIGIEEE